MEFEVLTDVSDARHLPSSCDIESSALHGLHQRRPSLSCRVPSDETSSPTNARLPNMDGPKRTPSSSIKAMSQSGHASCIWSRWSRRVVPNPERTPRTPSNRSPYGALSTCEPMAITRPQPVGIRPIPLPATSMSPFRPASRKRLRSQDIADIMGSDHASLVTPSPSALYEAGAIRSASS